MHKLLIESLSFSYEKQCIFEGLTLSFESGKPYLISAPSGRGKTTLFRLIAGLIKPESGKITGGGIGSTAIAFQESRLFPTLSAVENASIAAKKEDAALLLSELGFSEDDMQKKPHELSGGMRQRVSLCRALLSDMPLLLLDEPFKGLDAAIRSILYEMIRKKAKNTLVLVISHDLEDATLLDAAVVAI